MLCGAAACAQRPDPYFATSQFDQWASEGPHQQIPWKIRAESKGLTVYQRLTAQVVADIDGRYLSHRKVPVSWSPRYSSPTVPDAPTATTALSTLIAKSRTWATAPFSHGGSLCSPENTTWCSPS